MLFRVVWCHMVVFRMNSTFGFLIKYYFAERRWQTFWWRKLAPFQIPSNAQPHEQPCLGTTLKNIACSVSRAPKAWAKKIWRFLKVNTCKIHVLVSCPWVCWEVSKCTYRKNSFHTSLGWEMRMDLTPTRPKKLWNRAPASTIPAPNSCGKKPCQGVTIVLCRYRVLHESAMFPRPGLMHGLMRIVDINQEYAGSLPVFRPNPGLS